MCALSIGAVLSDPNYPKPPHFRHFVLPFIIFVVSGDIDFRFGRYVDGSKC